MRKTKLVLTSITSLFVLSLCGCNIFSSKDNKKDNNGPYTVTWKNYDDKILEVDTDVEKGSTPSYDGKTPTREDNQYEYTFDKWSPDLSPVTSDITYKAEYKSTLVHAKVYFYLNGGTSKSYESSKYMDSITSENFYFDVSKLGYNFRGWSYNGEKVFDNKGNQLSNPPLEESMSFFAMYSDKAEITITKNIEEAGTVTGAKEYAYKSVATLTATPNEGYVFAGWYYLGDLLSTEPEYNRQLNTTDQTIEARFKYDEYLFEVESYNSNLGLVKEDNISTEYKNYSKQNHCYKTYITVSINTKDSSHKFLGWFDNEGNLVDAHDVFTFPMPKNNYKLIAKWDLFDLSLSSNDSSMGNVTGGGNYKSNAAVTITATANNGYSFVGWFDKNDSLAFKNESVSFAMPTENLKYKAKFVVNDYSVTVSSEDTTKGTVTGSGTYAYNESVTITTNVNSGYLFTGWFENDTLVSSKTTYTFPMPYKNISYVARYTLNSYQATASSEDASKGTVTGSGNYEYKSSVTFTATAKTGYSFDGWYDGTTLISNDSSYAFSMPYRNFTYVAKFAANNFTVNVSSDDIEKGTVTGGGVHAYGTSVTLVATPTNLHSLYKSTFVGWYDGETCISTDSTYTFVMPNHDLTYVAKFNDTEVEKTTGDIYLFGSYPQSEVKDEATISNLSNEVEELPTAVDSHGWTAYNWYKDSSNETNYGWYIDLDINNDGQNDYRGVYYTSYRPYDTSLSSTKENSKQYQNGYRISTVYWFKYEPIKWKVIVNNSGEYYMLANDILDSEQYSMYASTDKTIKTDYQGNTDSAYQNNYKYSDLRSFLNVDFYNVAFTDSEASRIQNALVDNSVYSTQGFGNQYCCEDTEDKIFAPSYFDLSCSEYGFDNTSSSNILRRKKVSDYAACMGCYKNDIKDSTLEGYGYWWLRTPFASISYKSFYIDESGFLNNSHPTNFTIIGVVPALNLR